MSNTLTNLIPDLYAGLDTVSRELAGYIPAVYRDASVDRAAEGQSVRYHKAPEGNLVDVTPSMTVPEPDDKTIGSDTITISKVKKSDFGWIGKEQKGLNNNGPGYLSVQADMFAQALRKLVNEVESDLSSAAASGASRAHGTPGTSVFQNNINDVSQLRKILMDNGAPPSDLQCVLDTTAGAALRTLYGINADRDWSDVPFNQQGVLVAPHGLNIRETGQAQSHTAGTADSATTDNAGYSVGDTVITLASAGTGTILAGDVITFAGDSNQYVVASGDDDVSNGGTITLQEPGLQVAIDTSATDITVVNDGESNPTADYDARGVAFYRNAIVLAARAPERPEEGDLASDRMMLTDPRSGLMFEVSMYPGYRKISLEVALAWGVKSTQPRHTSLLIA